MSSAPAFIDISEGDQAEELLEYYASKGQKLTVSVETSGMPAVVHALAEHCAVVLKASDEDATAPMTSIFSLFHMVPPTELGVVVQNICKQISADITEKNAKFRYSLLMTLYGILDENGSHRADAWLHMLLVARKGGLQRKIQTDPESVKKNLKQWNCNTEKSQQVLRAVHDCLQETGQTASATDVLVTLLSMYTNPSTAQAKEDAQKCIVASIKDSKMFLFDHLLKLPAVEQLRGQPLFELLNIFVSGNYLDYAKFCSSNQNVIEEAGLNHSQCQHKMRILTFISLASDAPTHEVSFDLLTTALALDNDDDTEMLIIDAIRTTTVKAKIDQQKRIVSVSTYLPRTFGTAGWQMVYDRLSKCYQSMASAAESLRQLP